MHNPLASVCQEVFYTLVCFCTKGLGVVSSIFSHIVAGFVEWSSAKSSSGWITSLGVNKVFLTLETPTHQLAHSVLRAETLGSVKTIMNSCSCRLQIKSCCFHVQHNSCLKFILGFLWWKIKRQKCKKKGAVLVSSECFLILKDQRLTVGWKKDLWTLQPHFVHNLF